MKKLEGIIPYLISPVNDDGTVKLNVLSRLCNDLIASGVHGLCVFGSVGEFAYLTPGQKDSLLREVITTAAGRVPVVAGVSGFSIAQAVSEAIKFKNMGVDAIVVMLQAYFPLSEMQIANYFKSVASAVPDLPIILYSNPKYMHFEMSYAIFDQLIGVPNIQYFKDASGNTGKLLSIVNKYGNRFKIFSASAHIPTFVSLLGGIGWMAGPACLIPVQCVRLYELCKTHSYADALVLQKQLWKLNELFSTFHLVPCIKAGLEILGYDVGKPVLPLMPLSDKGKRQLEDILLEIRNS